MKISGLQIFWLLFTFHTGNMALLTIAPVIQDAKQDAWISFGISSILGILIVYLATKTALLHPSLSLVEYSRLILGNWLGSIIVIVYLAQWYSVIVNILSQFADFISTILLPTTPQWSMILPMVLLLIYVTYSGGIEGIGRCSEVFGPIVLFAIPLIILLSVSVLDYQRILPILSDTGLVQILKGALTPLSFFGESVVMLMLISFMKEPQKGLKSAIWAVAIAASFVSGICLWVLMIIGPKLATKLRHPAFDAVSYISIMDFIQNLEIIAALVWILSVFIKLALYFFLACYGTAQLFKIKNWRKTIWWIAAFVSTIAIFYPDPTFAFGFMKNYWVYNALPINMVAIPLFLLIVGSIRKKRNKQHSL